jgi:spermidine synthase
MLSRANVSVDVVELDPAVSRFALEYFGLPNEAGESKRVWSQSAANGAKGEQKMLKNGAAVHMHVGDGRHFLDEYGQTGVYDYVLHDVFTNGELPPSLFSVDALKSIKRVLKPDGILALVSALL